MASSLAPIDILLPLLDNVSATGEGKYMASAPTRRDRNPSLSIRELPDGRLLLYDHGGDSPADILAAVGLRLPDLFPRRLTSPSERRAYRQRTSALKSLESMSHEALIVVAIAYDVKAHRKIDDATWRRLVSASTRISQARAVAT